MQTTLSLPTCTFSFGLFFCLLWLDIHNGSIFFIQIQLNVKSVQPFCFFFQLIFKGKGLLDFLLCGFKLCDSFRLFGLGSFQSGGEL